MKKIILSFILIILVAIGGGIYYVMNNFDELIRQAIETFGSEATKTAVRVESVKFKLSEGSAGISGLTIANPKGYSMPYAFSLGETRLGINLDSLQKEPYIVNEIVVLAPEIFVEVDKDNNTNLNDIKNNLMASLPASAEPAETPADGGTAFEPKLIIRKIEFADGLIKAKIAALDNKEYRIKLPEIELTNLGGTAGLTPTELISEVINQLSDRANQQVKKKIKDELKAKLDAKTAAAKAKLDAKIAEEKARLEALKTEKQDAVNQKARDKLKGLLGR